MSSLISLDSKLAAVLRLPLCCGHRARAHPFARGAGPSGGSQGQAPSRRDRQRHGPRGDQRPQRGVQREDLVDQGYRPRLPQPATLPQRHVSSLRWPQPLPQTVRGMITHTNYLYRRAPAGSVVEAGLGQDRSPGSGSIPGEVASGARISERFNVSPKPAGRPDTYRAVNWDYRH